MQKKDVKKYKIFFADDDLMTLDMYKNKFEAEGFEVEVCDNSLKAIEQISRFQPDIIFLDLLMPGVDGSILLKKIKAIPKNQWIPIIIFSNMDNPSDKKACFFEGASDYLIKTNYTPKELLKYARDVLETINAKFVSSGSHTS